VRFVWGRGIGAWIYQLLIARSGVESVLRRVEASRSLEIKVVRVSFDGLV
jgi:hypothetical protein